MLRIMQAVALLFALTSLTAATAAQRDTEETPGFAPRAVVDAYFSERLLEADRILNRSILDSQGEPIGEISDVLVEPETGRVDYAIIARGGDLQGVRVLVPYEVLRYSYVDREFLLATDSGFAVGMAPVYAGSRGGVLTRREFSERYAKRLAQARQESRLAEQVRPAVPEREAAASGEEQAAGQAERGQTEQEERAGQEQAAPEFRQGLVELERLRNRPIRGQGDKDVGEIDSILVDPVQGSLSIAVVEVGGFLGMGEDLVAVPWNKMRFDWREREMVLAMSEQELERAPQVDPARRQVIFRDTPSGYEQYIYLEQRHRRAEEIEER